MATSKAAKIEAEIGKVKEKISEYTAKLRELESKKTAIENSEIVDIVRGMNVPLEELATMLQAVKSGGPVPAPSSGQNVHKPKDTETREAE